MYERTACASTHGDHPVRNNFSVDDIISAALILRCAFVGMLSNVYFLRFIRPSAGSYAKKSMYQDLPV